MSSVFVGCTLSRVTSLSHQTLRFDFVFRLRNGLQRYVVFFILTTPNQTFFLFLHPLKPSGLTAFSLFKRGAKVSPFFVSHNTSLNFFAFIFGGSRFASNLLFKHHRVSPKRVQKYSTLLFPPNLFIPFFQNNLIVLFKYLLNRHLQLSLFYSPFLFLLEFNAKTLENKKSCSKETALINAEILFDQYKLAKISKIFFFSSSLNSSKFTFTPNSFSIEVTPLSTKPHGFI